MIKSATTLLLDFAYAMLIVVQIHSLVLQLKDPSQIKAVMI